jgi:hypothetical protein
LTIFADDSLLGRFVFRRREKKTSSEDKERLIGYSQKIRAFCIVKINDNLKFFKHFGGYVNNLAILKALAGVTLAGSALVMPMQAAAANPVEECSKELLLSYFPESFVRETLKKFNVPQDKWESIVKELNEKDKEVVKAVEEKASKQNPNPLKDPQQRQAAVKIFRETLTEIFTAALKKNGVTDENQIQQMLDDVQQQKAKRFAQCMEQQRNKAANNQPKAQLQADAQSQVPATQPKVSSPASNDVSKPVNVHGNNDADDADDDDDADDND